MAICHVFSPNESSRFVIWRIITFSHMANLYVFSHAESSRFLTWRIVSFSHLANHFSSVVVGVVDAAVKILCVENNDDDNNGTLLQYLPYGPKRFIVKGNTQVRRQHLRVCHTFACVSIWRMHVACIYKRPEIRCWAKLGKTTAL